MKKRLSLVLAFTILMSLFVVMPTATAASASEWGSAVWSCTDWVQSPSNPSYRDGYWSLIAIGGWGGTAPTIGVDSEDETNTCLTTTTGGIRVELVDTLYNAVDEDGKSAMNTPEADLYLFEFDYKSEHGNFAITKFWNYASSSGMANATDMPEVAGTTLPAQSEWTHVALPFVVGEDCGPWGGFRLENLYGQGVAKFDNFSLKRAKEYNGIINGGFEFGIGESNRLVSWSTSKVLTSCADSVLPYTVTESNNTYIYQTGWGGRLTQSLPVATGTTGTYILEFDYKQSMAEHLNVSIADDLGNNYFDKTEYAARTTWTTQRYFVKLDNFPGTKLTVNFLGRYGAGTPELYLDNISFKEFTDENYDTNDLFQDQGFEYLTDEDEASLTHLAHSNGVVVWGRQGYIVKGGTANAVTGSGNHIAAKNGNKMLYMTGRNSAAFKLPINPADYIKHGLTLSMDVYKVSSTGDFGVWGELVQNGTGDGKNGLDGSNTGDALWYSGTTYPAVTQGEWQHISVDLTPLLENRDYYQTADSIALVFSTNYAEVYIDNAKFTMNAPVISGISSQNLIKNGDFENGTTSWGIGTLSDDTTTTPAVQTANGNSYMYQQGWGGQIYQEILIPKGTTGSYILEYDYKQTKAEHIWCTVYDNASTRVTYIDALDKAVSGEWTKAKHIIDLVNYQGTWLRVVLTGRGSGTPLNWSIDNVSLRPYLTTPENILTDGSYEAGTEVAVDNNWSSYATNEARTGSKSLKITMRSLSQLSPRVYYYFTDLLVGAEYTVSLWYKGSLTSGDGLAIGVNGFTGDRRVENIDRTLTYSVGSERVVPTSEWQQLSYSFVCTENNKNYIELYLEWAAAWGTVYIDDVSFAITTPPEALTIDGGVFYYTEWGKGTADVILNDFYYDIGYTVKFELKDGDTVLNTKTVAMADNKASYEFSLDLLSEKKKQYMIYATVFYPDGKEWGTLSEEAYKYDRPKHLNENGEFIDENGEVFYPILGCSSIPASQYENMKNAGINVVAWVYKSSAEESLASLDAIHALGMKVLMVCFWDMYPAGNSRNVERVSNAINVVKDHPAIFGYCVMDEPFSHSDYIADVSGDLRNSYKMIRAIDDNHVVTLAEDNAHKYRESGKYVDMLEIDPYPGNGRNYAHHVADMTAMAREAVDYRKPVLNYLQAWNWVQPITAVQFHSTIHQAFLGGSQALGYYKTEVENNTNENHFDDFIWSEMLKFKNLEYDIMFRHFSSGNSDTFNSYKGDYYWYESWIDDSALYVSVINRSNADTQSITVPLISSDGETVIEDYEITVVNGGDIADVTKNTSSFTANLDEYQAVLYKVTSPDLITPPLEMEGYDPDNLFADQGFEFMTNSGEVPTSELSNGGALWGTDYGYIVSATSVNGLNYGNIAGKPATHAADPKGGDSRILCIPGGSKITMLTADIGNSTTRTNYYKDTGLTLELDFYNGGTNAAIYVGLIAKNEAGNTVDSGNVTSFMAFDASINNWGTWAPAGCWNWGHMSVDVTPLLSSNALWNTAHKLVIYISPGNAYCYADNIRVTANNSHVDIVDAADRPVTALSETAENLTVRARNYSGSDAKLIIAKYSVGVSGKSVLESAEKVSVANAARITKLISGAKAEEGKETKIFLWKTDNTPIELLTIK